MRSAQDLVAAATAAAFATTTTATAARAGAVGAAETALAATAAAITAAAFTTTTAVAATAATAAVTTTTAAATTVAATAFTTTTATETTGAGRTIFHGTGFVHHDAAAAQRLAIHAVDCCNSFFVGSHFHKAEAFGTTCIALHHDFGAGHGTELAESLFQIAITNRVRQVADVKFFAH